MANNVNISMKEKRARIEARQELQRLDSDELTILFLDTVDAKTLSVMTASLKIARSHEERETARLRSSARRKAF